MLAFLNHLPRNGRDVVAQLSVGCIAASAVECTSALLIAAHDWFFPFSQEAYEKCMKGVWENRKIQLTTCLKESSFSYLPFKASELNCPETENLIFHDPFCKTLIANAPSPFWTVSLPRIQRVALFAARTLLFLLMGSCNFVDIRFNHFIGPEMAGPSAN